MRKCRKIRNFLSKTMQYIISFIVELLYVWRKKGTWFLFTFMLLNLYYLNFSSSYEFYLLDFYCYFYAVLFYLEKENTWDFNAI